MEDSLKYQGCNVWRNVETGELIEVDEFFKPVNSSEDDEDNQQNKHSNGFMITYLSAIISLIDSLGNKKMQVVKYILQKMDKSTNMLFMTTRELAEASKVSKKTVIETLKILEKADIIARKSGVIMIHSSLIHRGNGQKEKILLTRFQDIKESKSKPNLRAVK